VNRVRRCPFGQLVCSPKYDPGAVRESRRYTLDRGAIQQRSQATTLYGEPCSVASGASIYFMGAHTTTGPRKDHTSRSLQRHYVYVLLCSDDKFYIGRSSDLRMRLHEHQNGQVKSTKGRRPLELIFYEAFQSPADASRRER
jgi:putative endonuclease